MDRCFHSSSCHAAVSYPDQNTADISPLPSLLPSPSSSHADIGLPRRFTEKVCLQIGKLLLILDEVPTSRPRSSSPWMPSLH